MVRFSYRLPYVEHPGVLVEHLLGSIAMVDRPVHYHYLKRLMMNHNCIASVVDDDYVADMVVIAMTEMIRR